MMRKYLLLFALLPAFTVFAQTENFWTKKSDFGAQKRERTVSMSIGNFGYVGMGIDTNETVKNDWWQYDALTDTWTQKATLPGSVRRNAVGFAVGTNGYVGTGIDSAEAFNGNILKDFWEYNSLNNTWSAVADYPGGGGNGVYFATAFALDNKGFVVCGKIGSDNYIDEVWQYKPLTDTWMQLADFPGGQRYQLSSFIIGTKAYVGLGADYNTYLHDMWEFNPGNGVWTHLNDFSGGERGSACTFTLGERGFVCLGTDGGLKSDLWEYNPYTDLWTARASYGGSARKSAAAFTLYGKAYVGTGDGYSGKKASMYEYTPVLILDVHDLSATSVSISPNPATDHFTVEGVAAGTQCRLVNLQGQTVDEVQSVLFADRLTVDCSSLARGVYLLSLYSDAGAFIASGKVVVQ